jgi:hypothetical protein
MCFREFEDLYKRQNPINESIKALNELQGRTLHVYDFDDTLVKTKADVIVNRPDGSSYTLDSHTFATHKLAPGESYNFSNFDKIIKGSEPLIQNIKQIQKSLANPNIKTTILTARRVAFPIMKHLRDKYGIDTYVIAVGSSDPEVKADWIENQVKKGYTDIKFMDDSVKNLNAVGRRLANSNVNLTLINSLTGQETKTEPKVSVNEGDSSMYASKLQNSPGSIENAAKKIDVKAEFPEAFTAWFNTLGLTKDKVSTSSIKTMVGDALSKMGFK